MNFNKDNTNTYPMTNKKTVYVKRFLTLWALLLSVVMWAQGGDANKGAELFEKNCTSCHKIDSKLVGPQLKDITKKYDAAWLQKWIMNNEKLIASGDAKAVEAAKFDPSAMTVFEGQLQEQDVKDIITWLENPVLPDTDKDGVPDKDDKCKDTAGPQSNKGCPVDDEKAGATLQNTSAKMMVIGFGIIAILLILILFKVIKFINVMAASKGLDVETSKSISIVSILQRYRTAFNIAIILFAVGSFYGMYDWMINIDVNKDYTPQQPIYFSHKVHAGDNNIDCQYCHTSAKHGKTSGIPSLNVCMNCHRSINEFKGTLDNTKIDGTKEMAKIYEHIGFDVKTNTYTGKTTPIEWIRIHNMQDFVAFNHSQHVVAGEAAIKKAIKDGTIPGAKDANPDKENSQVCYACHGRVDKMEEVKMANTFTMGWCVECHRTTGVEGLKGNGYYKAHDYDKMHEMAKKANGSKKQTVAEIGGLECGKCHY